MKFIIEIHIVINSTDCIRVILFKLINENIYETEKCIYLLRFWNLNNKIFIVTRYLLYLS